MRGVICSEPNCTVSFIATSNEIIRPVILSRPAKTAVGCLILSASAGAQWQTPTAHPRAKDVSQFRAFMAWFGLAASRTARFVDGAPVARKAGRNEGSAQPPGV